MAKSDAPASAPSGTQQTPGSGGSRARRLGALCYFFSPPVSQISFCSPQTLSGLANTLNAESLKHPHLDRQLVHCPLISSYVIFFCHLCCMQGGREGLCLRISARLSVFKHSGLHIKNSTPCLMTRGGATLSHKYPH